MGQCGNSRVGVKYAVMDDTPCRERSFFDLTLGMKNGFHERWFPNMEPILDVGCRLRIQKVCDIGRGFANEDIRVAHNNLGS
jgi:hypothetical protein